MEFGRRLWWEEQRFAKSKFPKTLQIRGCHVTHAIIAEADAQPPPRVSNPLPALAPNGTALPAPTMSPIRSQSPSPPPAKGYGSTTPKARSGEGVSVNVQDIDDVETAGSSSASSISGVELDRKSLGSLKRGLSARQVQMIAIAGTIGTGLFLGTGRSLAQGGPASVLICYSVVGFVVYVTVLLLGEMATQYPVAGKLNPYHLSYHF